MLQTKRAYGGMVTAPHHLAAEAGRAVLREGGNALEAAIAAGAAIAALYPHMNGLGGDAFFLIAEPGADPIAIEASGRSAASATIEAYRGRGHGTVPARGPEAAMTVAGAVSGWKAAYDLSGARFGGRMPLSRLFEDAIRHAREGIAVPHTLAGNLARKRGELEDVPGFAGTYLPGGVPVEVASRFRQTKVADTLEHLVRAGLDDFYRGEVAASLAEDLGAAGSPVSREDLAAHEASVTTALTTELRGHRLYNMRPPTQGLASLILLALYGRLGIEEAEGFAFLHGLVEATKAAFVVRDAHVTDPDHMAEPAERFLDPARLDDMAAGLPADKATPWPRPSQPGDTVWLAAADAQGRVVSFIQSIYWEFGSGLVLPGTGVTWQNRGASFSLDPAHVNRLDPRRRPFHTIQPALAALADGSLLAYGTMGGEGQPQTQAAIFARHVLHGQELQEAVTAPRWLLGRTWGAATTNLKLESRFDSDLIEAMRAAGHDVEVLGPFEETMGHAGAIRRHGDGLLEGAADPRSDGGVAAF